MRYTGHMRRFAVIIVLAAATTVSAQRGARKPAPPPPAPPINVAPDMTCPAPLGAGVTTKASFCDVMTGRDPAAGILIRLPPHKGPVPRTFDLTNRHPSWAEHPKATRPHPRHTATI